MNNTELNPFTLTHEEKNDMTILLVEAEDLIGLPLFEVEEIESLLITGTKVFTAE